MKTDPITRRQFLQGAGGFAMALPFLPSLMSKAHAEYFPGTKYFVCMGSNHGGIIEENLYPMVTPANENVLYSGSASNGLDHRMRWDTLSNMLTNRTDSWNPNGLPELSPILGNFMNGHLDQINVVRGLDIMFYIAHHTGGYLGNFHGSDVTDPGLELPPMPTIDQLIGNSLNFYGANDARTVRVMNLASSAPISWGYSNGQVSRLPELASSSGNLFRMVFGSGDTSGSDDPSISLLNRVYDDYSRLYSSSFGEGRRISSADRNRLDEHMQHLTELEQRIRNQGGCTVSQPDDVEFIYADTDFARQEYQWSVYVDLISTAFKCGASRIATLGVDNHTTYAGDYHQNIAHNHRGALGMQELVRTNRFTAEHVFMALVQSLDEEIVPGEGTTYLDNSLIVWHHESGINPHNSFSMPCITAGSAGGYFNTGLYVDYRNLTNRAVESWGEITGLPHNRWLHTVLQAMGVDESEYKVGAFANMQGYGDPYIGNLPRDYGHEAYPQRILDDLNRVLPLIVA